MALRALGPRVGLLSTGLIGALAAGAPLVGQGAGSVASAWLRADFPGAGAPAHVRIDYRLDVPRDADRIPVTALVGESADLSAVVARTPTRTVAVEWLPFESAQRTGWIHVPGPRPPGRLALTVEYEVWEAEARSDPRVRFRVPVVAVDWPSNDPLPGTFRGRARVPPDVWIVESFPTALSGPLGSSDRSEWEVELSVVPAFVSLRGRLGPNPPVLTLPRVVDGSVLALLVVLGLVGWLRLKDAP